MIYNIDFLIAAIIFLLLVFYHFMSRRQLITDDSTAFMWFVLVGLLDIGFDIFCTMLITLELPEVVWLTKISLTLLYLMQVMVPYMLLLYTQTLCGVERRFLWNRWVIIPAIMMVLIIANLWTGIFFYFDANAIYVRGPLYMGMYGYALLYVLVVAVQSIMHYRALGKRKFLVIWEFLLIGASCVLIQACYHELLVTGFGIALGITVMFLTLNNPYEYSDNLTGLLDGQYFKHWVDNLIERPKVFHVVSVDLHRLKHVSKIMGNSYGDEMLLEAAKKLKEISGVNHLFRVSECRFVIIGYSIVEYKRTRDRAQKLFWEQFHIEEEPMKLSVIVCGILHGEDLKDSDEILGYIEYLVSQVPAMQDSAMVQGDETTMNGFRRTKEIEKFLPEAIEKDLFEMNYQPVYSIEKDAYVTLEALSRLRHPTLGSISPAVFIDLAEKSGQILQLGYLQFKRVCRFIKENEEIMKKIQNVKINMSPAEILKPGYSQMIIDTIADFGLNPSYFQFEITETIATEYSENLYRAIEDFRKVGIEMCLDDFGSGYANLDTVLRIPFSSIKLDRSLLSGISTDAQSALFYESIVGLFRKMGYAVIAEGVETKKERELVTGWGVDMIQGFWFSKPLPEKQVLQVL